MALAGLEPRLDQLRRPIEKREADGSEPLAQEVPVASLQRRTCDHDRPPWLGECCVSNG